jgi:hypothetical protein
MQIFAATPGTMPWGDFGRILAHGMSRNLSRVGGIMQLQRVGPFVPPVTMPGLGDMVVIDEVRHDIEASGLSGASFASVNKARVVRMDWQNWDSSLPSPPVLPDTNDPEDYILRRPDDRNAADAMGSLWELVAGSIGSGTVTVIQRHPRVRRIEITISAAPLDFFRVTGPQFLFVSERARDFLEQRASTYIAFEDVSVA